MDEKVQEACMLGGAVQQHHPHTTQACGTRGRGGRMYEQGVRKGQGERTVCTAMAAELAAGVDLGSVCVLLAALAHPATSIPPPPRCPPPRTMCRPLMQPVMLSNQLGP